MSDRTIPTIAQQPTLAGGGYVLAILGTAAAVATAALAQRLTGLQDLSLVFMLAVLVVASRTHTGPAVLTAILCFLAYNFFFIEPRFTFYISARHGIATVALFLAAALLAGRLASRLAMQVHALRVANHHARARQELGQRLAIAASRDDVVEAAHALFQQGLDADVWIRLLQPAGDAATDDAARSPVLRQLPDGHCGETVEEHGWWFLPLHASQGELGAIGLKMPSADRRLDAMQRQLARDMAGDVAQALLRTRLVADLATERVANESERLRNALLSSVSHDLRSPLASIIGAAESLQRYGADMDDTDRDGLLDTVCEEGQRLDRYIQNLLDMTRLGQGGVALERDWIGVDELVGSAIGRLQRYRPDARFTVLVDAALEPVWVQPALIEQALFNVIDNAVKFSPPGEPVVIDARSKPSRLQVDVCDRGPGIPDDERGNVFTMFYSGDRGNHGTGLGLAICRGMIEAHGGVVEALPGDGGGTTIRITLPLMRPEPGGST